MVEGGPSKQGETFYPRIDGPGDLFPRIGGPGGTVNDNSITV